MLAADLHIHLDGSLRGSTIVELSRRQGSWPASRDGEELLERLRFRPGMTLASCLGRFELVVSLLQSRETLLRAASELVRDAFYDGVRHVEIRFCPLLHTRGGLAPQAVVESVLEGVDEGLARLSADAPGDLMSAGLVVTVLEGSSERAADILADLAVRHAGSGVVGVDLAGDESLFDAGRYAAPLRRAAEAGLGITIHAGENGLPEHVRDAVTRLGADRIGHGVAAAYDPSLLDLLAERGVTVEVCVSSNVHTGAVAGAAAHPLPEFLSRGVSVALATDNTFFSSTTLSREYALAAEELGLPRERLAAVALESARAAFLAGEDRARLETVIRRSTERGPGDEGDAE